MSPLVTSTITTEAVVTLQEEDQQELRERTWRRGSHGRLRRAQVLVQES